MTGAEGIKVNKPELDEIAWQFLESEFTGRTYADWPIYQRIDAYLHHRGLGALANDGTAYDALLECVMANIGRAQRVGRLRVHNRRDAW